jgi:hypothetical protein
VCAGHGCRSVSGFFLREFSGKGATMKKENKIEEATVVVPVTIIDEVASLIARFIFFKDSRVPSLIATWIVGTYLHARFDYYGYLWVHSPVKRCGKTDLLKIIQAMAWRSSDIEVDPTPAVVRHLVDKGCTLIVDEMERLRDEDKNRFSQMMAIFNAGFAPGATVSRMEKGIPRKFSVYGPKIISGISTVTETIRDRSFSITMTRKKSQEQTESLNMRIVGNLFEQCRFALAIWADRNGPAVQAAYDTMGKGRALQGLDDRFIDIAKPLLAVLKVEDAESKNEVISLLKVLGEQRIETEGDEAIAALYELLDMLLARRDRLFVHSEKLLDQVMRRRTLSHITSTKSLAAFMEKFDFHPRQDPAGTKRGYLLTKASVAELRDRYL